MSFILVISLLVIADLQLVPAVQVSSSTAKSVEAHVEAAKLRREAMLKQREAQYHKELHQRQEEAVANLRRPQGALKDTPTNPDDYDAVVAFYQSTNGPKWANNTGWMKGDPCTSPYWYGIYCIDGRVLQINLAYNSLSGRIPTEIAKASSLQVLRLYSNMLEGDLPPELFTMQSLQILDVNTNQITGGLPSQVSMANLTQLSLYDNQMKGVFPRVFNAPNLQILEISSNSFSGELPESLSEAPGITDFVVSRNLFTGELPSSYGRLTKLQRFWTFYNNFDQPSLPESYRDMVNLEEIQADGLSGPFPEWIGSWEKMQALILINGQLTGSLPESLCDLGYMNNLRLFNNSLKGELPQCLCEMRKLTDFEISDNQFTGEIPDRFEDCRSLESIYLSRNNFTGEFPPSLGNPVNLTVIDVSSNGLYGTIPNSINHLYRTIAGFSICFNMFSDIESGVEDFFDRIKDYTCNFYNNPWSCPLQTTIPKECDATCSTCNAKPQRQSCEACLKVAAHDGCVWCEAGSNCLEGSNQGPGEFFQCKDWKVDSC